MRTGPTVTLRARRTTGSALRARQCGYGVLLALVILVLGSLYGLTRGLSEATAQTKHDDHDQAVLRQARDALVAYAALRLPPISSSGPGHLPCPDLNDDGNSEGAACATAATRTGRLPWRTLGLPDLRDSTGERLWFAVSRCFLERPIGTELGICPNGYRVNSDLRGALTVTGLAPENEVIAIILAPGAALGSQNRSAGGANVAANYLEGENGDALNDTFEARTACLASDCPGGAFNDKLLVIRAKDLFPVVENMVARHLRRPNEIGGAMFNEDPITNDFNIKGHYQRWRDHAGVAGQGYFPFAAPFVQPDTSSFRGVWNTPNGLMPVTKEATFVGWDLAPSAYKPSVVKVAGLGTVTSVDCDSSSTADVLSCDVRYDNGTAPRIRLTGYALNVAMSFVDPIQTGDVTVSSGGGTTLSVSNTHVTTAPPPPGSAQVDVVVNLAARADSATVATTITVLKPPYNTRVVGPNWFVNNNWHQVTLYSAAPAATTVAAKDGSTGNPICAVAADCLDAVNTANGGTGRYLLLMLSGLAVDNNTPRPAASLARYLEGRNVWTSGAHTPANQFEAFRAGKDRTNLVVGNDRLAVIAP